MLRIIDHKKLEMTDDEHKMYNSICRSYDRPNFKGEELFKDHFEVNDHGIILFVKPPSQRYTSMEVFCFLISLMTSQHLRNMRDQVAQLVKEASEKITELADQKKSSDKGK